MRFPLSKKVVFFDVETGGPLKNRSSRLSIPEFFKSSADKSTSWKKSAIGAFHANNPLLQLHATGIPYFEVGSSLSAAGKWPRPPNTFIKAPAAPWIVEDGERVSLRLTDWAEEHKLVAGDATQTEEEALSHFFTGLESRIADEGQVTLSGWNVGYDLGAVERAGRRYNSLSRYHGWMSEMHAAGKLQALEASDLMMETVRLYGERHAEFASKYLRLPSGKVASSVEELHLVPGWSLGRVGAFTGTMQEMRVDAGDLHTAYADTVLTEQVYNRWRDAYVDLQDGKTFEEAFRGRLMREDQTVESFFTRLYRPSKYAAPAALNEEAKLLEPMTQAVNWRRLGIGVAALSAAAVAAGMAFGRRKDRQTQIVGLSDEGLAADSRHRHSDFGSGWRGLDDDRSRINWQLLALSGSVYGAYRYGLQQDPARMFSGVRWVERFAGKKQQWLNVFGFSHWTASYLPEQLDIPLYNVLDETGATARWGVATQSGDLTDFGRHLQRLAGDDFDLFAHASKREGLQFTRSKPGSAYHTLAGTDREVRFVGVENTPKSGSRWAGASERRQKPLEEFRQRDRRPPTGNAWERWKQTVIARRRERFPSNPKYGAIWEDLKFQPLFSREKNAWYEALRQKAGILSLEMMERPQRIFSRLALGPKVGEWNNALGLGRKYLGIALGIGVAGLGLDYADYLSGHRLSGAVAGIVPKTRIAHAEATDRTPGARRVTDWYAEHVPGPQYGPLMLAPTGGILGAAAGFLASKATPNLNPNVVKNWAKYGMVAGAIATLPFLPGIFGSRKNAQQLRDEYSGKEPVAVRSGRWWEIGNSPWSGKRIIAYRPSWYARLMKRPERVALWGSEKEYWAHHPLLHPIKFLRNPYVLEEHNAEDRPYPYASPVGSNIPLIGPLVAATVGRLIKPPKRMHEAEWDGTDYTLFSPRVEPRGPDALPNPIPREEFRSTGEAVRREGEIAAELVGLPGWLAKTTKSKVVRKQNQGKEVFFEGSRQMTSLARRYYEQELGAGFLPTPDFQGTETYSEPFRRFVQRDLKTLQANEIPNKMPSWMPGSNYMLDFRHGDPYTRTISGSSRLPGPGYALFHPQLKGVSPEDYPLMEQFRILSDVAPWSTQWFQRKSMLDKDTWKDTVSRIEYERILERAEAMKASSTQFDQRRFSRPTEEIAGTVKTAGVEGIELEEMPGRKFTFSALGMSAADLSAAALAQQNELTGSQVATEVEQRQRRLEERLAGLIGSQVRMVVPEGTRQHAATARAVVFAGDQSLNQQLLDEGLASHRKDNAGAEYRAMSGVAGRTLGRIAEGMSFEGDVNPLNPMHWVASPLHSKLWQERTALEQYKHHEVYGSRMQKWEAPLSDIVKPLARGLVYRATGRVMVPKRVRENRDLDTLTDYLKYLRGLNSYTNNEQTRTEVGANLFGDASRLRSVLHGREKYYYEAFLGETSDDRRREILDTVSPGMSRILQAQWVKQDADLAGTDTGEVSEGGRLKTQKGYKAYSEAKEEGDTKLDFGDWERSREVANFFFRRNVRLPDSPDSPLFDPNLDYEDVKAKIVQMEGLDMHDYNIFDDRASTLWRKPYVDGAVRELTQGNDRSVEQLRQMVETMILDKHNPDPDVRIAAHNSPRSRTNITITVKQEPIEDMLRDVRENPDEYQLQEQ